MAGTLSGFGDGSEFRDNIRAVMQMGAPNTSDLQATFYFGDQTNAVTSGPVGTDEEGNPFSPETVVSKTPYETVKVPVGVEYSRGAGMFTSIGDLEADTLTLTLLDQDYVQVVGEGCPNGKGFEYVTLAGRTYQFKRDLMTYGLGPVDVHQILVEAVD